MSLGLPDYAKAQILVVGDVMLDRYWYGDTSRISPEAPVPVVHVTEERTLPGAAANVAMNLRSIGANVTLMSMTGDDHDADQLEKLLNTQKIITRFQRVADIPTIQKLRVLSQHQQLIRLDLEKNFACIDPQVLLNAYMEQLTHTQLVILSDYGKGVLKNTSAFIAQARAKNIPVIVDPKGSDFSIYQGATLLTPNRKEFEAIVGKCGDEEDLVQKGMALIEQLALQALLITRSEEGMTLLQKNHPPLHIPAKKQEVYDVTGAGDTVIAILGASLAAGVSLEEATVLANIAAGVVVSRLGAASVTPAELRRALHQETYTVHRGILSEKAVLQAIVDARAHGEKIVMTNGCFDILHPGHVSYLEQAKRLGDRLIVAVNDDASVQRLKGKSRPINSLAHRMAVLAGLAAVDWVVSFSEDTPANLISRLLPDVLVKGEDYTVAQIAGASVVLANGGEVKTLPFVPECSSSAIIDRIQAIQEDKS